MFAAGGIKLRGNEGQTVGPENAPMQVHLILLLHGGGLSLGGQVAVEMLSQRPEICRYALLESALVKPMKPCIRRSRYIRGSAAFCGAFSLRRCPDP